MTTPLNTGIPAIDAELQRCAPFPNEETAEAAVTRLLAVWRLLHSASDAAVPSGRSQRQRG
jgi:hypothetical protein